MRIYTRGGDRGKTALASGTRRWKHDVRVEAYGSLDEAGAFIGMAVSLLMSDAEADMRETLQELQQFLWDAGADLARVDAGAEAGRVPEEAVAFVEAAIDRFQSELPPQTRFVLRGGTQAAATLHVACTVLRRAERRIVQLMQTETVSDAVLQLVNRASDLLFVAALLVNQRMAVGEISYRRSSDVFVKKTSQ